MIFSLYPRVVVKLGADERHEFDRAELMFTEMAEIEKVTGLSYGEWTQELGRLSIVAVGGLLHVLRNRDGQPGNYAEMQFSVADLDVVPLHDDGTEFTAAEVAEDLVRRVKEAGSGADPTGGALEAMAAGLAARAAMKPTSPSSPSDSGSAPGNGTSSPGRTSARARRTSTRSHPAARQPESSADR